MAQLIDEVGNKYGRLTVVSLAGTQNNRGLWHCKCECGNECNVIGKYLRNGDTKSCGCMKKESYIYAVKANIKRNKTIEDSVYVHVFFSNSSKIMICDKKSWKKAKNITWHITENGRVRGNVNGKPVLFHDFIMDFTPTQKLVVDHINRNPLDNRLDNLRIVKKEINARNLTDKRKNNTSGCVGVSKSGKKWSVSICGKYIGRFETFEEAVKVRKKLEAEYFKGEKYEYMGDVNKDIYADYECIEDENIVRKISTGEIIEERVT